MSISWHTALLTVYIWMLSISLVKIISVLIGVAYFTIAERKVMGAIQRRLGPNVIGFWGLLQPLADGFKLLCKEMILPTQANTKIFILAPVMILTLSLMNWSIVPFNLYDWAEILQPINVYSDWSQYTWRVKSEYNSVANIAYGILFALAISGFNVYGIIIAGWASNSKYAFLGALRSAAQMISYEVSIGLVVLPIILLSGSLNFTEIVHSQSITGWYVLPLLPSTIMFFVSMIAETNRSPFDLPEAEAELVAGYNVEYSSIIFAMFFLGEYSNMLFMSTLIVIFFFGGWLAPLSILSTIPPIVLFAIKITIFCFLFVLVRASYPRYRYDQLMDLGWKIFLPLSLGYIILLAGVLTTFGGLPQILEVNAVPYTENILFDYFTTLNNPIPTE